MGICTKCGYLINTETIPPEVHECKDENASLMKGMVKLLYKIIVYADPASTAAQKSNALTFIQSRRTWIEANIDKLQEFIN